LVVCPCSGSTRLSNALMTGSGRENCYTQQGGYDAILAIEKDEMKAIARAMEDGSGDDKNE
jgi:hypothetical protein